MNRSRFRKFFSLLLVLGGMSGVLFGFEGLRPALADGNPSDAQEGGYALTVHECLASMERSLAKHVVGGLFFLKYCQREMDSTRYTWGFRYKGDKVESGWFSKWFGPKTPEECAADFGSELNKEVPGLEVTIFSRCATKQPVHPGFSAYTWMYTYTPGTPGE